MFISMGGLTLFDFDRCGGTLSNPDTMFIPALLDSGWWQGSSVAISPNNRFLYITALVQLYQVDLLEPQPFAHIDTIGIYDGFHMYATVLQTLFNQQQLAPDGKIYISTGNTTPYYHVINNPDLKGDSCNFVQRGLRAPSYCSNRIPNFPNYRLGKLVGSECDTITSLSEAERAEKEKTLKIFPNPATTDVTIDYGFTDWSKTGEITMEISNETGQLIYTQSLPRYSGFQKLNVASYPSGIYTAYIKRNGAIIATSKFAKQW